MTIKNLIDKDLFILLNEGADTGRTISKPYCCDLLSIAMSGAPADGIWFTVMANMNTIAVATLTETACIVLASGVTPDEATLARARSEGLTVFRTELPVFDAAILFYETQKEFR